MKIPLCDQCTFEDVVKILTLDVTTIESGTSNHEVIKIIATSREHSVLHGQDLSGRFWIILRLS